MRIMSKEGNGENQKEGRGEGEHPPLLGFLTEHLGWVAHTLPPIIEAGSPRPGCWWAWFLLSPLGLQTAASPLCPVHTLPCSLSCASKFPLLVKAPG